MDAKKIENYQRMIEMLRSQIDEYKLRLKDQNGMRLSLRQSQDRYRTVFEHTGTAKFVMDSATTITMINSGFERLTGYGKQVVEGRMRLSAFLCSDEEHNLRAYASSRAREDAPPAELVCRIRTATGELKHVLLKIDAIPGTQERIGSFIDITQLKKAEEDLQESRALLSAIVEGFEGFLYVSGPDFRLAYLNAQCQKRVGYNAIGEICYKAIHRRDAVCPFCVHDQVQAGQTVRFEMISPRDQRWYHSINTPIHHVGGRISLLAMVTDINDRKRSEVALQQAEIQMREENIFLRTQIKQRHKFGNIVGRSPLMQQVYEHILNSAASDATAIIYGEPGTGKELVARAIHDMSERRNRRFVPVHCGAIPENLIESEFFGYKKGAFSGAMADKPGYIDYAEGGTLFLDEVGEISLHMQVKLLRVIEGGGYTPVGSSQVKTSNVRIIAATNRDLKERIGRRMMREDFFYRIHILPIHLPPLRERKEDLPLLVDHFMSLYAGKRNLPPITGRLLDKLVHHDWPGNVRELQNVIIRYCNQKRIELMSTASKPAAPAAPEVYASMAELPAGPLNDLVAQYEKQLLVAALNQHQWHRQRVAEVLHVDRKTLFNKMKRYSLLFPVKTGE